MARPRSTRLDPQKVKALAQIGCTPEEIGVLLTPCYPGKARRFIDQMTVEKYCSADIKEGRMELHRSLKSQICKLALGGNVAALIFALKAYCGLKEPSDDAPRNNNLILQLSGSEAKRLTAESAPIIEAASELVKNYQARLNGNTENGQTENGNSTGTPS